MIEAIRILSPYKDIADAVGYTAGVVNGRKIRAFSFLLEFNSTSLLFFTQNENFFIVRLCVKKSRNKQKLFTLKFIRAQVLFNQFCVLSRLSSPWNSKLK